MGNKNGQSHQQTFPAPSAGNYSHMCKHITNILPTDLSFNSTYVTFSFETIHNARTRKFTVRRQGSFEGTTHPGALPIGQKKKAACRKTVLMLFDLDPSVLRRAAAFKNYCVRPRCGPLKKPINAVSHGYAYNGRAHSN